MRTSCVAHPTDEPLIIIRQWQLEFCKGGDGKPNECAAALLSFFEYWHSVKLDTSERNRTANDAAEKETGKRPYVESLLQWHSTEEIETGILIFKKNSIRDAIAFLVDKKVIEVHRNPSLKWDNTRYFLFHPEVLNGWLKTLKYDRHPKTEDRPSENGRSQDGVPSENGTSSSENGWWSSENGHSRARVNGSETTSETSASSDVPSRSKPNGSGKAATFNDELSILKEFFPWVDMEVERGKILAWLSIPRNSKRQITRKFLVNWLGKVDKPINGVNGHGTNGKKSTMNAANGGVPYERV